MRKRTMKIEEAMQSLREGSTIYRRSKPDFKLRREENGLCSFCVTIFDLLATDWEVQYDLFDRKLKDE